jgi:hypothetical protein
MSRYVVLPTSPFTIVCRYCELEKTFGGAALSKAYAKSQHVYFEAPFLLSIIQTH